MTTTYSSYSIVTRDLTRSLKAVQNQPEVTREVNYYLATVGNIKTADEFVSDRRLLNFAMSAFGLQDMAYAKSFVRKILKEGHDDSDAFVNKLSDKRYLEFAKTFDFKRYGEATTAFSAVQKGVSEMYVRQTLETQAGSDNEGVRLALYFQRHADSLGSATEILTDRAMTQVAKTVLRLPDTFSLINIDKQISVMESRINVADFKDPDKLNKFLKRFASLWDVDNSLTAQPPVLSLFNQSNGTGISDALMASLSKLRTKF
jgi:Protein of unknown function (DUF1217)